MDLAAIYAGVPVTVTEQAVTPATFGLYGLLPARWSRNRSRRKIKKHWKKTAGLVEISPAKPMCFQYGVGMAARFVMHPAIWAELQAALRDMESRAVARLDRDVDRAMRFGSAGPEEAPLPASIEAKRRQAFRPLIWSLGTPSGRGRWPFDA